MTALPLPATLVRSALFSAHKIERGTAVETKVLAIQGEYTLTRTGPAIGVGERDVWAALVGQLPTEPWPVPVLSSPTTALSTTLKALGYALGYPDTGGNTRLSIIAKLNSLYDTDISITGATHNIRSRLISNLDINTRTGAVFVDISAKFAELFKQNTLTLDPKVLQELAKKPLASWLYGYLQSHDQPFRMSLQRYRELSGSRVANLAKFKQNLEAALKELQTIGYLNGWEFDSFGNVEIFKTHVKKRRGFAKKTGEPGSVFDEETATELADSIEALASQPATIRNSEQKRLRQLRKQLVDFAEQIPATKRAQKPKSSS